ncbi:MAG: NVEALA domain-containing protein [Tannerellaceae bacterium]|jgi:hypothetical protein|nr:NVEALA domain-containing protein [Tannerellaceae bacterium]
MKKYFLSGAMIITVALAGWNISKNNSENLLSDIAMENVEALADEINPACPNGCISAQSEWCFCYYYHENVREAYW